MGTHSFHRLGTRLGACIAISIVISVGAGTLASAHGSQVLPSQARPHGYSRTDMTRELALFTTSGNNLDYYPDTPFQILYAETFTFTEIGGGLRVTGTGSFSVRPGTQFFVPIINATDSPPVAGVFPTTPAQARSYIFDPAQLGGSGFEIVVDGQSTDIGPRYVAGPVETPLLDGPGTHIVTLGAFLHPMRPGTHTVTIRGGYFGALMPTVGLAFLEEEFTYTVEVVRGRP